MACLKKKMKERKKKQKASLLVQRKEKSQNVLSGKLVPASSTAQAQRCVSPGPQTKRGRMTLVTVSFAW